MSCPKVTTYNYNSNEQEVSVLLSVISYTQYIPHQPLSLFPLLNLITQKYASCYISKKPQRAMSSNLKTLSWQ